MLSIVGITAIRGLTELMAGRATAHGHMVIMADIPIMVDITEDTTAGIMVDIMALIMVDGAIHIITILIIGVVLLLLVETEITVSRFAAKPYQVALPDLHL